MLASRLMHAGVRSRLTFSQAASLLLCTAALAAGATILLGAAPAPVAAAAQTGTVQQYQHDVLPVLQENCLRCHGGMNRRSGYSMSTRAAAIAGGHHGTAIVPGDPDASLLVKLIGPGPYPDGIKPMPLKGKLTDAEIATLRKWIADGAVMDQ